MLCRGFYVDGEILVEKIQIIVEFDPPLSKTPKMKLSLKTFPFNQKQIELLVKENPSGTETLTHLSTG